MATRKLFVPSRYIFTALVSIALAVIYGLKVNLSVAIVVMINSTELRAESVANEGYLSEKNHSLAYGIRSGSSEFACHDPFSESNKTSYIQDGPFAWPENVQGLVLGAYFWGYILTQIPGARIAEKYSAKWVIWISVLINVVFTILTPLAAHISYIAVLVARFIEGLGAGMSPPAVHVMLTKWVLPQERNLMSSLVYAGMALGTVLSLPFSGMLAAVSGWESVFYVQGGLAMIWCVLWLIFVYDSPQDHPRIHPEELELFRACSRGHGDQGNEEMTCEAKLENGDLDSKSLSANLDDKDQSHHKSGGYSNLTVPWRAIATSGPFWAIFIAHTCANFGWYMLLVELPTYMKAILRFNISENAGLSAIPYLSLWIFSIIWSNRLDWAKNKGWISTTTVRKLSTAIASIIPAACFVGVSLVGCNRQAAVALMTVSTMFIAGTYCGFLTNHVDIAPNYAGTLMALTNTAATVPGFLVPAFVGHLTHGNQTLGQWKIIFYTSAAVYLVEFVAYTMLGSGEEQPWNTVFQRKSESGKSETEGDQARRS
ncbi:putative inorganic phosphate cotransporter [Daphnia carinata]|uniref:putative inorganic phosphate cotransporter n=1 Tax=Daphnia carinata TaxID=120202 RepID=UPI002868B4DD|nr:putative inorganic phosphate cotransporter [Daphnia carinata]